MSIAFNSIFSRVRLSRSYCKKYMHLSSFRVEYATCRVTAMAPIEIYTFELMRALLYHNSYQSTASLLYTCIVRYVFHSCNSLLLFHTWHEWSNYVWLLLVRYDRKNRLMSYMFVYVVDHQKKIFRCFARILKYIKYAVCTCVAMRCCCMIFFSSMS